MEIHFLKERKNKERKTLEKVYNQANSSRGLIATVKSLSKTERKEANN